MSLFAALCRGPGIARVQAGCRLCVLPRVINTSIFSCYPFDLYYKQVAWIDVYPLQKVSMSEGSMNRSPISAWTISVLSAFPLWLQGASPISCA